MISPSQTQAEESNVVALPVRGAAPSPSSIGDDKLAELIELSERCRGLIARAQASAGTSDGARASVVHAMQARIAALEAELAAQRRLADEARAQRDQLRSGIAQEPLPIPVDPAVVLADARPVRGRRLMVWLAILALVVGILAVIDAFMTVVFQEPITQLLTARAQSAASDDLEKLESSFADDAGRAHETRANRRLRLAAELERESHTGEPVGRLLIPSLGLKSVFVEGAAESALRKGPGRYTETAMPGEPGTVGIAGHRTTYSAPFRDLDKLKPGQRIVLRMPYGRFSYVVTGTRIVSPQDAWVLRSYGTDDGAVAAETRSRLVLTACHPIGSASERIVVSARLASVKDFRA